MTTVVTNLSSRDLIFLMEENFYPYKILKTMGNDLLNASEVTTCRKAVEIFPPPPQKKKTMTHAWQVLNMKRLGHSKYEFDCICCPHNVSLQIYLYNSDPGSLNFTRWNFQTREITFQTFWEIKGTCSKCL